jgi:site-specific recombinase XerD
MEDIKGHKLGRASATLWLTRPQARALEDACRGDTLRDLRDRALIVVMLATGLRSSEALGLAVADLGRVEGYDVAWITGKGGARERVKLQDKARRALDAWITAAEIADGPVFRRLYRLRARDERPGAAPAYKVHGPLSYAGLKFILRERFAAAGLSEHLSPHSLRHSFVTLALRGGAPLAKVQHAARHANPQTTMRYAHEQDALDDNAADYVKW